MSEYDIDSMLKNIFDNTESNTWKPSDKIPLVIKEIDTIKNDLKTFLSNSSYDIDAILKESNELFKESRSVVEDMDLCKQEIEQETMAEILKSIENHDKLTKELQSVNFALNIVYDVVQCGKYVKEFDDGREAQSFTRAVEAVYDLLQHIEMPAEGFKQLDFYNNTRHTAQLILDSLLQDLYNEWDRLFFTSIKAGNRKTTITITLSLDDSLIVVDILNALDKSKKLSEKVTEFSQFLIKDVLQPIINNDCTVFAETDELMTITVNHKPDFRPPYDAVIANLRLLFHYLSNKLNFEFNREMTIMRLIGKQISCDFRDILVKDCLVHTIPNNINELQSYGVITSQLQDFQHFLAIVKFFPDENFSILQYINNIDMLFAYKSSQHFLLTARKIMKKDLSVSMSIGVEKIPEENAGTSSTPNEGADEALKTLDKTIPKSLFFFPRCMISKSAQELLDLVYVIMEQAVQCSDVVCKKLYHTTRYVFEMYDAIVPYYHGPLILSISQFAALFHNNCMYLSHNLQTFGDKWLILMEGRELDYPISFVDLVPKLRRLGTLHLAGHMVQQRKQILDAIRSSDLNCIMAKDVLGDNAEAAVRQCLRQLHILKNVWIGVFPVHVFTRLMTALVNMFVDELIHRVCTVEDISMEMATQLTEIYTLLIKKAPQLFPDPNVAETEVKSWAKLRELIFILGGSLKDIEQQWGEGRGPLATHFQPDELRNLVKALFQNTQFRANLLSKIK